MNKHIIQLSEYRTTIMGIAILLVMLYHYNFSGIGILFSKGYIGVDFFMFLSGLGLCYSMNKNDDTATFYKKRVFRILPVYIPLAILLGILCKEDNLYMALWRCTTLGFWTNQIYTEWYVPSILLLYALFPLLFKYIIKPGKIKLLSFFIVGISLLSLILAIYPQTDWQHFCLIYRIPIFLLGAMCTIIGDDKTYNSVKTGIILSGLSGLLIYVFGGGTLRIAWVSVMLMSPVILAGICHLLEMIHINKTEVATHKIRLTSAQGTVKRINGGGNPLTHNPLTRIKTNIIKFINRLGVCTLELYMIHVILWRLTILQPYWEKHHNITATVCIIMSIQLSFLFHDTIAYIINKKRS